MRASGFSQATATSFAFLLFTSRWISRIDRKAREVGHQQPQRIHGAGCEHRLEGGEGAAWAQFHGIGLAGQRLAIGGGGAMDGGHAGVAHAEKGAQMKLGDETAADQADAQPVDFGLAGHGSPDEA